LSFREECLKRAKDQAAQPPPAEGLELDEKLARDALCEKVLQRTAIDPAAMAPPPAP
jgi:hypothetical protein